MDKQILYIGNQLSLHGYTPTHIESTGPLLEERYRMYYASSCKNPTFRIIDMLSKIFIYQSRITYVIIDTYSTKSFWYALFCSFLCRLLGIKYIPVLHGGNLPARLNFNPLLSKQIFGHSYENVSPSGYLKHEFEKEGYHVQMIPNTIKVTNYPFKKRKKIRARLLWVRSFASTYNPQMAVKVLHLLLKQLPDAELCMVGPEKDGSLKDCKILAKQMNLYHKIRFTGKLSKRDWIELSSHYDIFISTTNFDNTPVSIIEAMALGLPVISTNVGGVPYLIENNSTGVLTEKNNPYDMGEKVKWLIKNPDKARQITLQARKKAEQFDWNVIKQQWFTLLQ
jgi:glycosyltransferase involved in cell wall biosynthesis